MTLGTLLAGVDDTTFLFPAETMSALDRRYVDPAADISVLAYATTPIGNGQDATAAVEAALAAAPPAGMALRFPAGRYVVGNVRIPNNVRIYGDGKATVLVQRSDTEPIFNTTGREFDTAALTADVQRGATIIPITGYAGNLAAGDWIVLGDRYSYDPTYDGNLSGELLQVDSVTSTAITVTGKVKGAFTASGAYTLTNRAYVNKVTFTTGIEVDSLTFEGRRSATAALMSFYYARNLAVRNVACTQGGDVFISLKVCQTVHVSDTIIENLVDDLPNNHNGYGVNVSTGTGNVVIDGMIARNVRHAVTTSGGGKGIPRSLVISNVSVTNRATAEGGSAGAGIDTHCSGDDIVITGCVVSTCGIGITVRSKNTTVVGNVIRQCTTGVRISETLAENVVIRGNTIEDSTVGIDSSDVCAQVFISENVIKDFGVAGIRVQAPITGLNITGNTLVNGQRTGISFISTCTGVLIADNTLIDMSLVVASASIESVTGANGAGRVDVYSNRFLNRTSPTTARCVQLIRGLVQGNASFGTFNSTRWSVNGANQTGNTEYA